MGVALRLIVIPCLVALFTWLGMRLLQDWWFFAALADKRPGIVFVAAMMTLALVVISEFIAYQRQVAVRALANRLSLHFSPKMDSSLAMEIKHLVIGKGSSCHAVISNVMRGHYHGMQLVMADLAVGVTRGDDTDWQKKTLCFFTDRVSFFPNFTILPRTGSQKAAKLTAGDVSHFPPFSKLYTIASDEQEAAEHVVTSEFRDYFKSRYPWQVHAHGNRIAFVRDEGIAVDQWERYLREAFGAVKLLNKTVEKLLERQNPVEGEHTTQTQGLQTEGLQTEGLQTEGLQTETQGSGMWGSGTKPFGNVEKETKTSAARVTGSLEDIRGGRKNRSRGTEELRFEKEEPARTFAVVESLIESASQRAVLYQEVTEFMQGLPPRTVPRRFRNENVPRIPGVVCFLGWPFATIGLVLCVIGILNAAGIVGFGDLILLVFGGGLLFPFALLWGFFYRRRSAYFAILREGVCASATVRSNHLTEDYDIEDWLMCNHRIEVSFLAGRESVNGKATVKGMQMKTLQRCLKDEIPMLVLYMKNRPKCFLLAIQVASRRFAE